MAPDVYSERKRQRHSLAIASCPGRRERRVRTREQPRRHVSLSANGVVSRERDETRPWGEPARQIRERCVHCGVAVRPDYFFQRGLALLVIKVARDLVSVSETCISSNIGIY